MITGSGLPPPDRRFCVVEGFGEVVNGKIRYDWPVIVKAWHTWPNADLPAFAERMQIPAKLLYNKPWFGVREKRVLLSTGVRKFRQTVLDGAVIARIGVDQDSATRSLARILSDLQETVSLATSHVRSRLGKQTTAGLVVNPTVHTKEVRACMEVAWKASETIKNVLELNKSAGNGTGAKPRPQFKPVLREPAGEDQTVQPAAAVAS